MSMVTVFGHQPRAKTYAKKKLALPFTSK